MSVVIVEVRLVWVGGVLVVDVVVDIVLLILVLVVVVEASSTM